MKKLNHSQIRFLRIALLDWFKKHQRPLPWRKTYDPYQVWISEIMLQQTQVKTVLPYFERWMKMFPTIRDVAEAKEDKVLKLWEGLGYYSRARNIHKAAKMIAEKYKSRFPEQYEAILSLPGIGKYTAGAISSIAFKKDRPLVDGNVIRVITRWLDFHGNVTLQKNLDFIWNTAGDLLPSGKARDFNQALMELGALICAPVAPKCTACPVQKICSSYQLGTQEQLPHLGKRQKLESIQVVLAVIKKGSKVFIQKRPSFGLMGGLWEFPGGKIEAKESPETALHREIKEELGVTLKNIKLITKIKHGYTRFKVNLHCFYADFNDGKIKLTAATKGKWVLPKDLHRYPFPAANVKLISKFLKN